MPVPQPPPCSGWRKGTNGASERIIVKVGRKVIMNNTLHVPALSGRDRGTVPRAIGSCPGEGADAVLPLGEGPRASAFALHTKSPKHLSFGIFETLKVHTLALRP